MLKQRIAELETTLLHLQAKLAVEENRVSPKPSTAAVLSSPDRLPGVLPIASGAEISETVGPGWLVQHEIQALELMDRALLEDEQRYRSAVTTQPELVCCWRPDQTLTFVNDAVCQLFGMEQDALLGMRLCNVVLPEDLTRLEHDLLLLNPGNPAMIGEYRIANANVQGAWYKWSICAIYTQGDPQTLIEYQAVGQEVVNVPQLATSVHEEREFVDSILEYSSILFLRLALDGTILSYNHACEHIFGYPSEVVQHKQIWDIFVPPEERSMIKAALQELQGETLCNRYECNWIVQDGTRHQIVWSNTVLHDPWNKERYILSIGQDITQYRQIEAALRESERRFRAIFNSTFQFIGLLLPNGTLLELNQTALDFSGMRREDIVDKPFWEARWWSLSPETQHQLQEAVGRAAQGEFVRYAVDVLGINDTVITIDFSLKPVQDDEGNIVLLIPEGRDITDIKRAEAAMHQERLLLARRVSERTTELSVTNAELARALRSRDEFLANMSHELRTPLNAILGLSESLQEHIYGDLNAKQQTSLQTITESGRHLLSLINDILDLAKIEAGHVELDLHTISVSEVCASSLRLIKQMALQKGLEVFEQIDPAIRTLRADARRLKQILVNLLSNAVKFTPEGGQIGLEVRGDQQQQIVHFVVWDTGIGIAPEHMDRLFRAFVQVDSSLSRHHQGTGLGLALVARLAEMHGGGVTVESQVDQGSCFTVALPWQHALKEPTPDAFANHSILEAAVYPLPMSVASINGVLPQPPKIMLAEDNEVTIGTITDYFHNKGYDVTVARNGEEAIARACEEYPRVILIDIQMPKLNGLQVIQRLRREECLANIPIVALTALAMPGDRERCLDAGATAYLSKPVSLQQLLQMVQECLQLPH